MAAPFISIHIPTGTGAQSQCETAGIIYAAGDGFITRLWELPVILFGVIGEGCLHEADVSKR